MSKNNTFRWTQSTPIHYIDEILQGLPLEWYDSCLRLLVPNNVGYLCTESYFAAICLVYHTIESLIAGTPEQLGFPVVDILQASLLCWADRVCASAANFLAAFCRCCGLHMVPIWLGWPVSELKRPDSHKQHAARCRWEMFSSLIMHSRTISQKTFSSSHGSA